MKLLIFSALFLFCFLCDEEVDTGETSGVRSNASDNGLRNHFQLKRNAYVIAELEDRLVKLKAKLGLLSSEKSLRKTYSDIRFRVGRLEGTGCSDSELQCGGTSRQCVSNLLVCDGVKDCKNGRDEDTTFCDTSALKPSTAYTATVQLKACVGGGNHDYTFRTEVRTLHRSKIFPSRLTFTEFVQGFVGGRLVMSVVTAGEYQRGSRRFRTHTPGEQGIWSECVVPEGYVDRLYCSTFKGTDTLPCLRHFVMTPVKSHS